MKTLKEALFSRKNLRKSANPFGLTKEDLKGDLKEFPMGVVVRMMEEQELQGNKPDVTVFQRDYTSSLSIGGFNWYNTPEKYHFWDEILNYKDFKLFFEKYPEYERYNP